MTNQDYIDNAVDEEIYGSWISCEHDCDNCVEKITCPKAN